MTGLAQDLRGALRAVRRAPIFSAVAVGCLAVGIGVNAAAFSVLDALLIRDLPGVHAQSELNTLVFAHDTRWGRTGFGHLSTLEWDAFREAIPAFGASAVMGTASVALEVGDRPMAVRGDFVSGGFFALLGTRPAAGRFLTPDDDRPGAPPAVVISDAFWERQYERRQNALGSTLFVGNVAFTIVGVAPTGFVGLYPGEFVADPEHGAPYVFLPVASAPMLRAKSNYATRDDALDDQWLLFIGRRQPGATVRQVEAQAQTVASAIAAEYPAQRANATAEAREPSTASLAETIAGVTFVMAVPIMVLLVACANLANQLLARAVSREREIAVRLSLGATRARIVRQLLVESALLAVSASVIGIIVARLLIATFGAVAFILPFRIPIDARVSAFSVGLAFVTALAFGLVPALRATGLDLAQTMKEGAKAGGLRRSRLRSALVVVQVGASVAMLALTGVFVHASQRSRLIDLNANADRLLSVTVDINLMGYSPAVGRAFQSRALERLAAVPGVVAVAMAPVPPVGSLPEERIRVDGDAPDTERYSDLAWVNGDWFATRDMHAIAGRLFTAAEARAGAAIVVVDETAAKRFWPNGSPLGQTMRISEDSTATLATVVGVIPTVPDHPVEDPEGLIIAPAGDRYDGRARFFVRTRGNAADLRGPVRAAVQELDARMPIASVATLGESLDESAQDVVQMAAGVGVMGAIALVLAALGLSTVLAFIVEQRRFEIGVRIALGARSGAVTWMILRQSLTLSAIGIVIGASVAVAVAALLRNILFGVPPAGALAFGGSTALILVVALASSAIPACRASRVDPMITLRAE